MDHPRCDPRRTATWALARGTWQDLHGPPVTGLAEPAVALIGPPIIGPIVTAPSMPIQTRFGWALDGKWDNTSLGISISDPKAQNPNPPHLRPARGCPPITSETALTASADRTERTVCPHAPGLQLLVLQDCHAYPSTLPSISIPHFRSRSLTHTSARDGVPPASQRLCSLGRHAHHVATREPHCACCIVRAALCTGLPCSVRSPAAGTMKRVGPQSRYWVDHCALAHRPRECGASPYLADLRPELGPVAERGAG